MDCIDVAKDTLSHDATDENRSSFNQHSICDSVLLTTDVRKEIKHSFNLSDRKSSIISQICREQDEQATGGVGDPSLDVDDQEFNNTMQRPRLASDAEAHRQLDSSWYQEKTHVFVMSRSGKPIYTLHGDENKLVNTFSLLSMLVGFVEDKNKDQNDAITSINMDGIKFVFLLKYPLIFVASSRHQFSELQIQVQLNDVYNLILSIVTLAKLKHVFKKENYDMRCLLIGEEEQITNLLNSHTGCKAVSNTPFTHLTNSMSVLKLNPNDRDAITGAIKQGCAKIENIVFAVLIAAKKVVAIVCMRDFKLHPADVRLLINILDSSEQYKQTEVRKKICLPNFDKQAHLNAHISSFQSDSKPTLILLRVDGSDKAFEELSMAKSKIVEKLKKNRCLDAIDKSAYEGDHSLRRSKAAIPEMRHFIYKKKKYSQIFCSEICEPYVYSDHFERLVNLYFTVHHRIDNASRPITNMYENTGKESILVMTSDIVEIYAVFDPTTSKNQMVSSINQLQAYIQREEKSLFILKRVKF